MSLTPKQKLAQSSLSSIQKSTQYEKLAVRLWSQERACRQNMNMSGLWMKN